jgi:hypothetical protein
MIIEDMYLIMRMKLSRFVGRIIIERLKAKAPRDGLTSSSAAEWRVGFFQEEWLYISAQMQRQAADLQVYFLISPSIMYLFTI